MLLAFCFIEFETIDISCAVTVDAEGEENSEDLIEDFVTTIPRTINRITATTIFLSIVIILNSNGQKCKKRLVQSEDRNF